nr:MAG TPA: hypothetical protein [Caudoviricetes sp.]
MRTPHHQCAYHHRARTRDTHQDGAYCGPCGPVCSWGRIDTAPVVREKNGVYYETPRLKGHIMTRILVSTIKTVTFILGIVLASCFIGRGANNRMKHVLTVQQRFISRRDNRLNRW